MWRPNRYIYSIEGSTHQFQTFVRKHRNTIQNILPLHIHYSIHGYIPKESPVDYLPMISQKHFLKRFGWKKTPQRLRVKIPISTSSNGYNIYIKTWMGKDNFVPTNIKRVAFVSESAELYDDNVICSFNTHGDVLAYIIILAF